MKTWAVQGQISAALEPLGGIECAFVFGSHAAGTQHSGSDIDLLVIGSIDFSVLSEAMSGVSRQVGREISSKLYRPDEWRRKLDEGNSFLLTVARGPKIYVAGNEGVLNGIGDRKLLRYRAGARRRVKS